MNPLGGRAPVAGIVKIRVNNLAELVVHLRGDLERVPELHYVGFEAGPALPVPMDLADNARIRPYGLQKTHPSWRSVK
jgi:hypothetical protein